MKPIDFIDLYDGRHYDRQMEAQFGDQIEDVLFYYRQIEAYGQPVLELACGTGRLTIPLAERGVQIAGLDISESMLARAQEKATAKELDIEWIHADCRDFHLNQKFNLIFFPFNSMLHLHDRESLEACFSCVKKHLTETGRFIIDVFNPRLDILIRDPNHRYYVAEYPDPYGNGTVIITENNQYDTDQQINYVKWYYKIGDAPEIVRELNMRILYPQELDTLLYYNGFKIEQKYENFDQTPFTTTSGKQLIIARF